MRPRPLSAAPRLAAAAGLTAALLLSPLGSAPASAADPTELSIAAIQGTGAASAYDGTLVRTTGVVTAVYPKAQHGLAGFVIQTEGTGGARRDLSQASDAVFVYTGSTDAAVGRGDAVSVTATVDEYQGLTELTRPTVTALSGRHRTPKPVTGIDWVGTVSHRENLESMLYSTDQTFTVANTFTLQYGELGLAAGTTGELPVQPTDVAAPGTPANAQQQARNAAITVGLDDGTNRSFFAGSDDGAGVVPYLTRKDPVAVGDRATLTSPVVVDYRNGRWTFEPTGPTPAGQEVARLRTADRPSAPRLGGAISIASFNVLNYFTTVGATTAGCTGRNVDTTGSDNVVGGGCDLRGAWDDADRTRQQDKIVAAINKLNASVTGLMEIENSVKLGERPDEALAQLVRALNKAAGFRKWAYVPSSDQLQPVADQDVITSALIFQPAKVKRVTAPLALGSEATDDGPFGNARTPIAAGFRPVDGGGTIMVAVNHFKSKGSGPAKPSPDADQGNGQGAWNATRVAEAKALLDWVPSLQAAGDTSAVALIGDFNSYSHEDPLQALFAGGFDNAAPGDEYSYSFDGLAGSLDHVLLNQAARSRLVGAQVWNINAGQSPLLEYSEYRTTLTDYYRADPYRSSDHDPVIAAFGR